ncbi:MAG: glycosyltransferase family 1 protein [Chloroflexi bacterium]|nr:MAG: glycosyltransferase family 1 protein [Chloroflexota bacterium]
MERPARGRDGGPPGRAARRPGLGAPPRGVAGGGSGEGGRRSEGELEALPRRRGTGAGDGTRTRREFNAEGVAPATRPRSPISRLPLRLLIRADHSSSGPLDHVVLDELKDIALDLTWTWEPRIAALFAELDPELWQRSGHNPILLLARLGPEGVRAALLRPEVRAALDDARAALRQYRARPAAPIEAGAPLSIAYFSLEFGLTEGLPIYSGGLGVLAGDHLKAASDLALPLVGVGLLYRQGFGRQRIDDQGGQYEVYPENVFQELPLQRVETPDGPLEVTCPLGDRPAAAPSPTACTCPSRPGACPRRSCSASAACAPSAPWAWTRPSST